jgi:hypothetical protein
MHRVFAPLLTLLLASAAQSKHRPSPLKPLELATAPHQEVVTASLTGSLMYEDGCLWFREDRTKNRLYPVWPVGSTFNGSAVIFHPPGKAEQPIIVAEQFVMSGRPVDWRELAPAYYARFQQQCGTEPFLVSSVRPAD